MADHPRTGYGAIKEITKDPAVHLTTIGHHVTVATTATPPCRSPGLPLN
jgi:hypothetical protein